MDLADAMEEARKDLSRRNNGLDGHVMVRQDVLSALVEHVAKVAREECAEIGLALAADFITLFQTRTGLVLQTKREGLAGESIHLSVANHDAEAAVGPYDGDFTPAIIVLDHATNDCRTYALDREDNTWDIEAAVNYFTSLVQKAERAA